MDQDAEPELKRLRLWTLLSTEQESESNQLQFVDVTPVMDTNNEQEETVILIPSSAQQITVIDMEKPSTDIPHHDLLLPINTRHKLKSEPLTVTKPTHTYSKEKITSCIFCNVPIYSPSQLQNHLTKIHCLPIHESKATVIRILELERQPAIDINFCKVLHIMDCIFCSHPVTNVLDLKNHVQTKHHFCNVCGIVMNPRKTHHEHLGKQTHQQCPYCRYINPKVSTLMYHIGFHKPRKCSKCQIHFLCLNIQNRIYECQKCVLGVDALVNSPEVLENFYKSNTQSLVVENEAQELQEVQNVTTKTTNESQVVEKDTSVLKRALQGPLIIRKTYATKSRLEVPSVQRTYTRKTTQELPVAQQEVTTNKVAELSGDEEIGVSKSDLELPTVREVTTETTLELPKVEESGTVIAIQELPVKEEVTTNTDIELSTVKQETCSPTNIAPELSTTQRETGSPTNTALELSVAEEETCSPITTALESPVPQQETCSPTTTALESPVPQQETCSPTTTALELSVAQRGTCSPTTTVLELSTAQGETCTIKTSPQLPVIQNKTHATEASLEFAGTLDETAGKKIYIFSVIEDATSTTEAVFELPVIESDISKNNKVCIVPVVNNDSLKLKTIHKIQVVPDNACPEEIPQQSTTKRGMQDKTTDTKSVDELSVETEPVTTNIFQELSTVETASSSDDELSEIPSEPVNTHPKNLVIIGKGEEIIKRVGSFRWKVNKQDHIPSEQLKVCKKCTLTHDTNNDQHFCKQNYKLQCFICNLGNYNCKELVQHIKQYHPIQQGYSLEILIQGYSKLAFLSEESNICFYCSLCSFNFATFSDFKTHVFLEHQYCNYCSLKCDLESIPQHFQHCNCKSFICGNCTDEFMYRSAFMCHCTMKHNDLEKQSYTIIKRPLKTSYTCPYCKFQSKTIGVFAYHVSLHTSKICSCCDEKYIKFVLEDNDTCDTCITNVSTTLLPIVASMIQNLPCLFCTYVCQDGLELQEHCKITHEKCCLSCNQEFHSRYDITMHKKYKHRDVFQCSTCWKKFTNKRTGLEHAKLHDSSEKTELLPKKKLVEEKIKTNSQCAYCLQYLKSDSLFNHLYIVHKLIQCTKCVNWTFKELNCNLCVRCQPVMPKPVKVTLTAAEEAMEDVSMLFEEHNADEVTELSDEDSNASNCEEDLLLTVTSEPDMGMADENTDMHTSVEESADMNTPLEESTDMHTTLDENACTMEENADVCTNLVQVADTGITFEENNEPEVLPHFMTQTSDFSTVIDMNTGSTTSLEHTEVPNDNLQEDYTSTILNNIVFEVAAQEEAEFQDDEKQIEEFDSGIKGEACDITEHEIGENEVKEMTEITIKEEQDITEQLLQEDTCFEENITPVLHDHVSLVRPTDLTS